MMWHGMFLFVIGLVTGMHQRRFNNMRMALSAHLEGVMNGTFALKDQQTNDKIAFNALTMVGSVRDACGGVPSQSFTSMQFEGAGTFNGSPATFRVCLQQNQNGANTRSMLSRPT